MPESPLASKVQAQVLKTARALTRPRGFESHTLRLTCIHIGPQVPHGGRVPPLVETGHRQPSGAGDYRIQGCPRRNASIQAHKSLVEILLGLYHLINLHGVEAGQIHRSPALNAA
ncbi:MAG: hypothetical protein C5B60_04540 [Chloroflexi bacterium]|nr:MAG: hypothetical protein C5B60_04540 [Chloroflexota bacterium]